MASQALTTGTPPRAPSNVHAFPTTQIMLWRIRLRICHSRRMLDRWSDDFSLVREFLPTGESDQLVNEAAYRALAIAEAC